MAFHARNNTAFIKPEAVLEQAIALDGVGKANDALAILKPIFIQPRSGKPIARVWTQALEDATMKYIELGVKQKLPSMEIRNALSAFKSSSINTNAATTQHPQSVIRIIKFLLQCAEKTVNFNALNVADGDDEEDDDESPDAFAKFLQTELSTQTQSTANLQELQRKNRAMTALRTYWEYYRISLDTIRPIPRSAANAATPPPAYYPLFRALYEEILRQAFENCGKFKLAGDFRRLAWRATARAPASSSLSDLVDHRDTAQHMLTSTLPHEFDLVYEQYLSIIQTKAVQLNVAISLQSWVEISTAFAEITDVLTTINDSRLLVSPTVILIQCRFLDFLWSGSNSFLHAAALKTLYDRLTEAQRLNDPENVNYIDELLKETQTKAAELNFPTTSWAFASFTAIQNGIILSLILAQGNSTEQPTTGQLATQDGGSASAQQSGGRLFGGLSHSPSDYNFSPLNTHSFYVTSDAGINLQNLFAHATGVAAHENAALAQAKALTVDPSFYTMKNQVSTTNIEVFKYIALLSFDGLTEPTIPALVDFVNAQFSSPASTSNQIYQLFVNLTNKTLTPLRLNRLIAPHLQFIANDAILKQYSKPLYNTIVRTILGSLSNMYSTLSLKKFITLLPPSPTADPIVARAELESIITSISVQSNVSVKIDHATDSLLLRPFPQQIETRIYSILGSVTTAMQRVVETNLRENPFVPEEMGEFYGQVQEGIKSDVDMIRQRYILHREKVKLAEEERVRQEHRAEEEARAKADLQKREQELKLEEIKLKREREQAQKAEDEAKQNKLKQIQTLVQKNAQEAEAKSLVLTKEMKKQLAKMEGAGTTEKDLFALAKKVELQKKREFIRLRREQKKFVDFTVRAMRSAQRDVLLETKEKEVGALEKAKAEAIAAEQEKHKAAWEAGIKAKKLTAHIVPEYTKYRAAAMATRQQQYEQDLAVWKTQQDELVAEQKRQQKDLEEKQRQEAEIKAQRQRDALAAKEAAEEQKRQNFKSSGDGYQRPAPPTASSKFLSSAAGGKASKFSSAASTPYTAQANTNNTSSEKPAEAAATPTPGSKFLSRK